MAALFRFVLVVKFLMLAPDTGREEPSPVHPFMIHSEIEGRPAVTAAIRPFPSKKKYRNLGDESTTPKGGGTQAVLLEAPRPFRAPFPVEGMGEGDPPRDPSEPKWVNLGLSVRIWGDVGGSNVQKVKALDNVVKGPSPNYTFGPVTC
ncbi:hypothetical protein B0F90DRAFT_1667497 [Multifurca ochricompacta]|uniref:Uncharacterized protein n=1 Tax=Multifurca ochricompacta TaxID=376703 RepID=A0AAD4M7V1_9AGAM|nr:hypothetical protein B0F90DRAFT_1667497 [Multifurca ochricompacta]